MNEVEKLGKLIIESYKKSYPRQVRNILYNLVIRRKENEN